MGRQELCAPCAGSDPTTQISKLQGWIWGRQMLCSGPRASSCSSYPCSWLSITAAPSTSHSRAKGSLRPPYLSSGLPGFTRGFTLKHRANLPGIKAAPGTLQGQPCLGTQLWGPLRDAASLKRDTGNSCQRKHSCVCWMKGLGKVPAFPLSV